MKDASKGHIPINRVVLVKQKVYQQEEIEKVSSKPSGNVPLDLLYQQDVLLYQKKCGHRWQ
jgi:hypothetical protein